MKNIIILLFLSSFLNAQSTLSVVTSQNGKQGLSTTTLPAANLDGFSADRTIVADFDAVVTDSMNFDDGTFFINALTNRVGFGTRNPLAAYHNVIGGLSGVTWNTSFDKFIIESNNDMNIAIGSSNSKSAAIAFSDNDARGRGALQYNHSTDKMYLWSSGNASSPELVLAGAKVGINTFGPGSVLEVNLGTSGDFRQVYSDSDGSAATYVKSSLSSAGVNTLDAVGSAPKFVFQDTVIAPIINATTGFQIGGIARDTSVLAGNNTNFVAVGKYAFATNFGLARLAGATFTGPVVVPAETFSSGWNGDNGAPTKNDVWDAFTTATFTATVTQSGSDTLLNSATCYGHLTRQGEIVTVTVRIELGLTVTGSANTVYFDPPIASNFTAEASDVIGTANMETQSAVGGDIPQQRCFVFASTGDDKIGISFDPPAALVFPANRQYISASFSYVVQ